MGKEQKVIINFKELFIDLFLALSSIALWGFLFKTLTINLEKHTRSAGSLYTNTLLLFVIDFSILFLISQPMYSFFKKNKSLNVFDLYFKFESHSTLNNIFNVFSFFVIISIFFHVPVLTYILLDVPIVSAIIAGLTGAYFGFSLGMECRFEQDLNKDNIVYSRSKKYFDHSLPGFIPFVILIFLIIVPVEILIELFLPDAEYLRLFLFLLLSPVYKIGDFLGNKIFCRFEVTSFKSYTNIFIYNFVPIFVIIMFQSWEYSLYNMFYKDIPDKTLVNIVLLLLVGILPFRLLFVFEPGLPVFNRVISGIVLIIYLINKFIFIY